MGENKWGSPAWKKDQDKKYKSGMKSTEKRMKSHKKEEMKELKKQGVNRKKV